MLTVIYGPMASGKSTELLRQLSINHIINDDTLYISHQLDQRPYITHNRDLSRPKCASQYLTSLAEASDIDKYEVIGVDEAQFFDDLELVRKWVEEDEKHVIVAGLITDYRRRPFGKINQLLAHADYVHCLRSVCMNCKDRHANGIYTIRCITGGQGPGTGGQSPGTGEKQIDVGGLEMYKPVCRRCYLRITT